MIERPVIPCKYCQKPTPMLATKLCDNCWEVERRLTVFLRSSKARRLVLKLLAEQKEKTH